RDINRRRYDVTARSPVTSTSIYFYLQSCAQENGKGEMSNKLLTPARLLPHILVDSPQLIWVLPYSCGFATYGYLA
ncbi:hypothetical protein IGI04_019820, partial [Brassica rapa subsp. trilocularis]